MTNAVCPKHPTEIIIRSIFVIFVCAQACSLPPLTSTISRKVQKMVIKEMPRVLNRRNSPVLLTEISKSSILSPASFLFLKSPPSSALAFFQTHKCYMLDTKCFHSEVLGS